MWSLVLMTLVAVVGATVDYGQISTIRAKSQTASDLLALTASATVRDLGRNPQTDEEEFLDRQTYAATDFNLNIAPPPNQTRARRSPSADRALFQVLYDYPQTGEVQVNVNGKTRTSFLSLLGIESLNYNTHSIVKYQIIDKKDPATIMLVLDNSGSMKWPDGNGSTRILALKGTVKGFMQTLKSVITLDENGNPENVLRTGMSVYGTRYYAWRSIQPHWGLIEDAAIDRLGAGGGTNTWQGLHHANISMSQENYHHSRPEAATPTDKPLKIVILMTDGVNSYGSYDSKAIDVCKDMHSKNITVYSIGYVVEEARAHNMLLNCASSPDHYFKAKDTEALKSIFDNIGKDLVNEVIRISS